MAVTLLKLAVLVIDILLLVLGVVLAAIGIWVLAVDYGMVKLSKIQENGLYSSTLLEPGLLETAAVICIAVGGVVVVTCVLALHGLRKESKCCLALTVALFVALILMDVIVIILTGLTNRRTEDHLQASLMDGVRFQYDSVINSMFKFSVQFDRAQVLLECCGVTSYTDFNRTATVWREKLDFQIPRTCCVLTSKSAYLDDHAYKLATPTCHQNLTNFHQQPCLDPIKDWMREKTFVLLAVSAFTACVKAIGSLFNILLLRRLKEEAPYNDL